MQRYQPPHLRQRAGQDQTTSTTQVSAARGSAPPPGQASSSRPTWTNRGGPSRPPRGSWSKQAPAGTYDLASPASDLRPMRRPPASTSVTDEMELLQSVSRSGGDGAEGDALKDWEVQERYWGYIQTRVDKHHETFSTPRHRPPPAEAADELQSLGSIMLLYRKLREGVVASHRIDPFAIRVFEAAARLAILARIPAQLMSSLSGLIPGLYTTVDPKGKARQLDTDDLSSRLDSVSLSENRAEFTSILLLYHLAHADSRQTFHSTLIELTAPVRRRLRSPFSPNPDPPGVPLEPFIRRDELAFALQAARALATETFDPFAYFRLLSDPKASTYERAVLAWAEARVRERAWAVMSKAYLDCRLEWAGRWVGIEDERKIGQWAEEHGRTIHEGRIKLR